jgi:DNA-binding PadR family transcriptional regulator
MSIKHAVLGLLVERRGYGYELMQRLEERLGPAWQLNPSSVYAALDYLEAKDLVASRAREEPGSVSRGQRRVVYEATPAGRAAFEKWVRDPASRLEPVRSEILLKLITARAEDVPALLQTIDHAESGARALCEECRSLAGHSRHESGAGARKLVVGAAILRLDAELRWLQVVRDCLMKS